MTKLMSMNYLRF